MQARFALWAPGGPLARELAKNPSVLIVNDTVFVHGGLTVEHVNYGLERLNLEVAQWMRGDMVGEGGRPAPPPFLAMGDQSSVMWNRTFSKERFPSPRDKFLACSQLKEALEAVGCERMVVGHTPQFMGCNCECNKKVRAGMRAKDALRTRSGRRHNPPLSLCMYELHCHLRDGVAWQREFEL